MYSLTCTAVQMASLKGAEQQLEELRAAAYDAAKREFHEVHEVAASKVVVAEIGRIQYCQTLFQRLRETG